MQLESHKATQCYVIQKKQQLLHVNDQTINRQQKIPARKHEHSFIYRRK